MISYLQQKLSQDDRELFNCGACHVFADELASRSTEFRLSRLADVDRQSPQMQALHVFVSNGSQMIAVGGRQAVESFLISQAEHRAKNGGPRPKYVITLCSREELFTPVPMPDDEQRGLRNKWRLLIDPEFVAECRRRARALLASDPVRYRMSPS